MTSKPTPQPPEAGPDIINENGRFYADHFGEYVPCRRKGIASKSLWNRTDRRKTAPRAPGMPEEAFWWWASGSVGRHESTRDYQVVEKYEYDALRAYTKRLEEELKGLRAFKRGVDEALNSGDGIYRP